MARSAREFAKLVFEISLGSWRHARGMARNACEFAKLVFEIILLQGPVDLVRLSGTCQVGCMSVVSRL